MERTTTISDRPVPKSNASNSVAIGHLEALDEVGQVCRSWSLVQARCTIGSSTESLVCVDDSSMAGVHAMIVFGKNHSLIRALGGQVRISGRNVREWLIDEPTMIQCGATRLMVYPPGFRNSSQSHNHRVAPGSVTDQASRLRAPVQQELPASISNSSNSVVPPLPPVGVTASHEQRNAEPVKPEPTFVVAKLDPSDVKAALEPLHRAVQEASDGILALTRRATESAAKFVEIPPINNNLSEMAQTLEALDGRVNTITQHCENLIANVSETIDGRLDRLDAFLSKLAESPNPSAHAVATPIQEVDEDQSSFPLPFTEPQIDAANDQSDYSPYNTFYADQSPFTQQATNDAAVASNSYFSEPENRELETGAESGEAEGYPAFPTGRSFETDVESVEEFHYQPETNEESVGEFHYQPETNEESIGEFHYQREEEPESPEPTKPTLPSWFTESESTSDESDEIAPAVEHASSRWASVQLNPIYAEDTNSWLREADIDQQASIADDDKEENIESLYGLGLHEPVPEIDATQDSYQRHDETVLNGIEQEIASIPYEQDAAYSNEPEYDTESSFAESALTSRSEVQPSENEEAVASPASNLESTEHEEESIEDYMSRLLQRVKGTPGSESQAALSVTPVPKAKAAVANATMAEQSSDGFSVPPKTVDDAPAVEAGEFVPRKAAPERSENLAALRMLANDTARQAFQNNKRKRIEMGLIGKFAVAGLGFFGGIFLLVLNGFNANVAMIGMIASFVVCLLWGYEAIVQVRLLRQVKAIEASEIANT